MTQIQAYENMSKEALIEHHKHTLQQHADDMDMLSKELASRKRVAPEGQAVVEALNDLLGAAHPAYIQDEYLRNKLIKARDKAFKALEKNRLDQKEKGGSIAIPTAEKSSVVAAQCTCPSGNGSLRWPCPAHPPESVNLTKSSNQQVDHLPKDEWIKQCAKRFMARACTPKDAALEMAESCHSNMGNNYVKPRDAADEEMSYWDE